MAMAEVPSASAPGNQFHAQRSQKEAAQPTLRGDLGMNRFVTLLTGLALAGILAPPATAQPAEALTECLSQPGAVLPSEVTFGSDLVCVESGQTLMGSEGDDTYQWVDGETGGMLDGADGPDDPGNDTLSLELWTTGYRDVYDANGYGGMFVVRVYFVPEEVRYTIRSWGREPILRRP
jgi:hypothetical protein